MSSSPHESSSPHGNAGEKKPKNVAHGVEDFPQRTTRDNRRGDDHDHVRRCRLRSPDRDDCPDNRSEDEHRHDGHERAAQQIERHAHQMKRMESIARAVLETVTYALQPDRNSSSQDYHAPATDARGEER